MQTAQWLGYTFPWKCSSLPALTFHILINVNLMSYVRYKSSPQVTSLNLIFMAVTSMHGMEIWISIHRKMLFFKHFLGKTISCKVNENPRAPYERHSFQRLFSDCSLQADGSRAKTMKDELGLKEN